MLAASLYATLGKKRRKRGEESRLRRNQFSIQKGDKNHRRGRSPSASRRKEGKKERKALFHTPSHLLTLWRKSRPKLVRATAVPSVTFVAPEEEKKGTGRLMLVLVRFFLPVKKEEEKEEHNSHSYPRQ